MFDSCFCFLFVLFSQPFVPGFQYTLILLKIVIEGIRGQSYQGDIAIDDLWIDDSPCPPEGHSYFFTYALSFSKLIHKRNKGWNFELLG